MGAYVKIFVFAFVDLKQAFDHFGEHAFVGRKTKVIILWNVIAEIVFTRYDFM